MAIRIIGVDPGMARLGYGVVERGLGGVVRAVTFGVIETAPGPLPDRLKTLYDRFWSLLETYGPDSAAVEQLFFGHNAPTALAVGQARGVVLLALARYGCPVLELKPAVVKQAVAGWGRADKVQVQRMVTRILGLEAVPRPDDAADALAVAWCAVGHLGNRRTAP
jgi:crossover junction endodeoxyribonuclease RuvC